MPREQVKDAELTSSSRRPGSLAESGRRDPVARAPDDLSTGERREEMIAKFLKAKTAVAAASAVLLTSTAAAAATGSLPGSIQHLMSLTAASVGISLPSGGSPDVQQAIEQPSTDQVTTTTAGIVSTTSTTDASPDTTSTSTTSTTSTTLANSLTVVTPNPTVATSYSDDHESTSTECDREGEGTTGTAGAASGSCATTTSTTSTTSVTATTQDANQPNTDQQSKDSSSSGGSDN